jgi:hypothetical protein
MTKKKNSSPMKKLIPAAGMLMVSAMMLASSTYAWFSMNKDVTVQNMAVTIKSDQTFLLVGDSASTLESIKTAKSIITSGTNASQVLYPTAHNASVTNISTAEAETDNKLSNWWYSYSTDPADDGETDKLVTTDGDSTFDIAHADISNYILINEFHIATATGSNALSNLRVKNCTITPATGGAQAVKVLVAGADGCEEFSGVGGNGNGTSVLQTANVTDSALSTVKVYIYWDGQDDDVNTNNIANLKSTSVSVVFTGDVVATS